MGRRKKTFTLLPLKDVDGEDEEEELEFKY